MYRATGFLFGVIGVFVIGIVYKQPIIIGVGAANVATLVFIVIFRVSANCSTNMDTVYS
jgi:hypothetical protein